MTKTITLALLLFLGVAAFVALVPIAHESWTCETPHGPIYTYSAQASLSFRLIGYGMMYGIRETTTANLTVYSSPSSYEWETRFGAWSYCRWTQ